MTTLERVPDTWDSDRDEPFFRITARLLPAPVVAAASALLASYDDEPARVSGRAGVESAGAGRRVPARVSGRAGVESAGAGRRVPAQAGS